MIDLICTIPWKGSENQALTLLAMGITVAYSCFIVIGKKDSNKSPRKSLWNSQSRTQWK